ncbi:putative RNA recognition motif domain, nucleotide-binding alpha-beta plait domain superfamily [Helianthus annuus]|nr:putative RNA recognition motif domain, nucleotide-binding alpha-beta plait domain superfamily [Helianthus annuus]KAJ0687274.1 putative RNA recognition motif domain, nucleotide-binding alpha-beta plait domain superfamily [Helianthus annuus]KAJ0691068.1 putative RNA recognition motif domain, nucleotide-binding alpha-beta plait domain superfamily [Helianthus annuus]
MTMGVTKFFVDNIPDGCRPWDLATLLGKYGDLSGSYIARKRSKEASKFSFVSFKGVKDWRELEGLLQGLKFGGFKLKINRARFAKENDLVDEVQAPTVSSHARNKEVEGIKSNNRFDAFASNGRSYSSVLLNNGGPKPSAADDESHVKEVNVHNETSAFFDLQGRAVVGRAKDLGSLINMRVNLRLGGVSGVKYYYLGGFYLLLAFEDEVDASDFLLNLNLWKDWFASLDMWSGQSLAYEGIAWLRVHGVPLHLAENKVFDEVAGLSVKW